MDTYRIAHTAQCKLKIAASRPDRNLRFLIGHAFTLDNLLLRIVEIEKEMVEETEPEESTSTTTAAVEEKTLCPVAGLEEGGEDDAEVDDEDNEDEGLSLQRFDSASAQPPRHVQEQPREQVQEGGGPTLPDHVTRQILETPHDRVVEEMYNRLRSCPCVKNHVNTPVSKGIRTGLYQGRRIGVVEVGAE